MSRRKRLQDRDAAIVKEQRKMLDDAEKDDQRDLGEEEQRTYDGLTAELERVAKDLEVETRLLDQEKRLRTIPNPASDTPEDAQRREGHEGRGNGLPKVLPGKAPNGFDTAEQAYRAGKWIAAEIYGNQDAKRWCQDYGVERRVMTGISPISGSAIVPIEFSSALINLKEQYGMARRKCRIWPMGTDTTLVPRRTGGVTAYFVGEESAPTASDVNLDNVQLNPRTLACLTRISKELEADAMITVAGLVAEEMGYALAVKEDQCLFLGDGTSTYGGIVGLITACAAATATISTALTANTAFSTLDMVDFEAMIGMLPEFPGIQPEWYISKVGWAASMMRLADAAGGNTALDIEGVRRQVFLGYPVNFMQAMNTTVAAQVSTNGLCYLGDLRMACTLGNRQEISIEADASRYFEYRQIGVQAYERFDINVHDVGDTSIAGAMIMLATPTS